jgi:hypothetical protein
MLKCHFCDKNFSRRQGRYLHIKSKHTDESTMSFKKKRGRSEEEIISVDSSCEDSIKTKIDAFIDACEMIEGFKTDEIVDKLSIFISRWKEDELEMLSKYYDEKMSDISSEETLSKANLTKAKEDIRSNNEASLFFKCFYCR